MMVRPLHPADLEALLALDAATHSPPWSASQWQDSLANHLCLGLEADGKLIGFAIAMLLPPDEAELLLIAVEPSLQAQGLGKKLFADLLAALAKHQCRQLFLEVRESNVRARHFYAATGMAEIGRRKNYYPASDGREDALLLAGAIQ